MEKPPGHAAAAVCGNLSYVSRLLFNYFEMPEFGISQTLTTVCVPVCMQCFTIC